MAKYLKKKWTLVQVLAPEAGLTGIALNSEAVGFTLPDSRFAKSRQALYGIMRIFGLK